MRTDPKRIEVTSTTFQNNAGRYLEQAAKTPVVITKYRRPARVLLDIDEYERLKALDTRRAGPVSDLNEEEIAGVLDVSDLPEESHRAQRRLTRAER